MADPYQGGVALGEMLFGRADPKAGLAEQGQVYKNASALEQARIDRAKRMAYDALPDAVRDDPELGKRAALNQALATINPNLSILAEGNLKLGDLAVQGQRAEAIDANQIPRYNQLTQLQAGKEYQPVVSEDGNLRPSGIALGDENFQVMPLPQTLATIEQKEASAERTRAAQGNDARKAQAAVDKALRSPQGGKKPSTASSEANVLAEARAAIAAGAPVGKVRARLKERGYSKLAGKL